MPARQPQATDQSSQAKRAADFPPWDRRRPRRCPRSRSREQAAAERAEVLKTLFSRPPQITRDRLFPRTVCARLQEMLDDRAHAATSTAARRNEMTDFSNVRMRI